ncbi:ribonucleotide-diphosphate reductase subunit beta [Salmonella enterica subsp. enterica serovar Oranienburg]|uniref:ribonucleoside-diphosphate reductase n=1 Tax=Salmonella enterica TaxID=28901 RepID=A0A5T4T6E0_SALER|nr:ribonucleotide-diphosphate reductase subunit beta [Salmonella enterica]EBV3720603.1 ribonucleotide-diphosphate reductase subunit beta [Salmonella enterica subsp. enterica serovar Oranienburg]EBL8560792.1 ribonucleotide-diphosphate reductase subunit beta [Salmonella enterica]EBY7704281.1 ribonucleotide-diphosphate reductase subunit beta [Salmonella enterica subsp. enterica serovar Oranienburg]ECY5283060.1 ribonucleotide-diphosphate reductase subunit beta [Salmonella enterica subsp. enterica s
MSYSTFRLGANDATKEPMFLGQSVNVARYDQQKYRDFEKLIEKQLSFFWRPEEVDITTDRIDFNTKLQDHERHIFLSNLRYQTLLDSVQGRSPNTTLLPLISIPELETWVETWSFSETIHSRSYTHIIRGMVDDPSIVFDGIVTDEEIISRAISISTEYDKLYEMTCARQHLGEDEFERLYISEFDSKLYPLQRQLFRTLVSINALEAIRFYVSFACTFAFGERKLLEGNTKIMRFIARDEALHCEGTERMIRFMRAGREGLMWKQIATEEEDFVYQTMMDVAEQEMRWADYLFKNGSMIGLNAEILKSYVKYRTNLAMRRLGLTPLFPAIKDDPLVWMNKWLLSDTLQIAPQEAEQSTYLVGQIDSTVNRDILSNFVDL